MVVKVTRKRVCDICESEDGVCRYRITKLEGTSQHTVTSDLCVEHQEQVERAFEAAPVPKRGRKTARTAVTLAEVAAKKAPARKRAAVKKTAAPHKRS